VVVTKSGRVISGLIVEAAEKTLTLQTQQERIVVERSDIDEMKATASSLMPEGLFQNFSDDEIRDLAAYLMSSEQSPLPADAK
jgi:putative heme-binding domain-containing protein